MKLRNFTAGAALLAGVVPSLWAGSDEELLSFKKRLLELEKKTAQLEAENKELRKSDSPQPESKSVDKIKLSNSVTELALSGDLTLRQQFDQSQETYYVTRSGRVGSDYGEQRDRWRFRLRLNADFKLGENWFGGVGLASNQVPDSGYTTLDGGFQNYGIYISKAFLGWNATDWATLIAGKQANPFYTTELVWDSNINPVGLVESIRFHSLFDDGLDDSKGSGRKAAERPWELTLVAGQFYFDDNNEYNLYRVSSRDAYIFEQQLIASYQFRNGVKATLAPAYFFYTPAKAAPNNVAPFSSKTSGLPAWVGESSALSILQIPGDVTFKLLGKKAKILWDFTYNFDGARRVREVYQLNGTPVPLRDASGTVRGWLKGGRHSGLDDFAYLLGIQWGENKKSGDWALFVNYRQVGLAAVDPNINEGTWGGSRTNLKGWKAGISYSFTDAVVASVTYYYADALRKGLYGGQASGGSKVANYNKSEIIQLDFAIKF